MDLPKEPVDYVVDRLSVLYADHKAGFSAISWNNTMRRGLAWSEPFRRNIYSLSSFQGSYRLEHICIMCIEADSEEQNCIQLF